jgi:RNA polymerase sigma-70 factor (ECF subfamily)
MSVAIGRYLMTRLRPHITAVGSRGHCNTSATAHIERGEAALDRLCAGGWVGVLWARRDVGVILEEIVGVLGDVGYAFWPPCASLGVRVWQGFGMRVISEPVESVPVVHARLPFEVFYRDELPGVVALCLAVSRRPWVAEELAQEAFLRAYRRWDTVGGYECPDAWVRRVALNLTASWGRRVQAETRALLRSRLRSANEPVKSPPDDEFWAAVRSLPRRQAQTLALYYVEDRPVAEIATVLGIEAGTVRVHLTRGRRNLAARLGLREGDSR